LDEVAGLQRNELTSYRRSGVNALKAQAEETSHGPCCDRFGGKGIADLYPFGRRNDRGGRAAGDEIAGEIPVWAAKEPGGDGDVCRGVRRGGAGPVWRTRGGGGAGDVGAVAWGGTARDQDRRSGCSKPERGVMPDGKVAWGARPLPGGQGAQGDVLGTRDPDRGADETGERGTGMDAKPGVGNDPQRSPIDVSGPGTRVGQEPRPGGSGVPGAGSVEHRATHPSHSRSRRGARGRCAGRPDKQPAHDGSRRGTGDGDAIRRHCRRRDSVPRCPSAPVLSGTDPRREFQLRQKTAHRFDQSWCRQGQVGPHPGRLGGTALLQGRSGGPVVEGGREATGETYRRRCPGSSARRSPIRDVARSQDLRPTLCAAPSGRLISVSAPADFLFSQHSGNRLSVGVDRGEAREGRLALLADYLVKPIATRRRISTRAAKTADSRLRQSRFPPFTHLPLSRLPARRRTDLLSTGQPLHSRASDR